MSDVNEIRALKASLRGAIDTAQTVAGLQAKVEAIDDQAEPDPELLAELARITTGHAVAASALRGLVESMLKRREAA